MLRLRKITNLVLLTFVLAVTFSCSEDEEVLEQQDPQSQINAEIADLTASSTQQSVQVTSFSQQTDWYENLDPTVCGVDAMLLAYEVFDLQGNSLSQIEITVWVDVPGFTFESTVNDLESSIESGLGQDIDLVFVSGLLVKTIDDNNFEYAEVNSYTIFSDYFNNCQSDDVVFQVSEDGDINWTFMDTPAPQDDVVYPEEPCLSIVFPIDIVVADEAAPDQTFQVTVTETEFIDYISGNISGIVVIDFAYPIDFEASDGTIFTANSITEVEQLFEQECD
jgi:hypothetical protein